MTRVIVIHEHELKPGVQANDFEHALRDAEQGGPFALPGFREHHFLRFEDALIDADNVPL